MSTFEVRTNVPYAVISYGNRFSTFKTTADLNGIARFEWRDFAVYVNAQKTGHVFSDRILPQLPSGQSWGQTSAWYLVSRLKPTKELFGLHKLDVPAERLLEEAEIARRRAEEELRERSERLLEEAEIARRRAEEELRERAEEAEKVCVSFVTRADRVVPSVLSPYFPITLSGARWVCEATGKADKITGVAKVRMQGYEFDVPIRNGFGKVNIGAYPEFKTILRELGV